jgi:uroporphyrinogen decarboxylase
MNVLRENYYALQHKNYAANLSGNLCAEKLPVSSEKPVFRLFQNPTFSPQTHSSMAHINMESWRKQVLESPGRLAIPIMTHPGIDIIGKSVLDAVTDGETHFRAIQALDHVYPSGAATIIMDLTIEAEAFGCTISFHENEVPAVTGRLVKDFNSVQALQIPQLNAGRVQQYLTASRLTAKGIQNKPVFGGCIGPFSLAARLFDMTEIMTAVFIEPETVQVLTEKCSAFIKEYVLAMKATGVNGIIMAEPAAGLLDEASCETFSSAVIRRIVTEVQDEHFLFILHNCGNKGHLTRSMVSTGAHGLHFGNALNLTEALQLVPQDILVFGNLDPVNAFKMMKPGEMYSLTMGLLEATRDHSNFIISSGCDTPPHVPLANIEAFYHAVKDFIAGKQNSLSAVSENSSGCACCQK